MVPSFKLKLYLEKGQAMESEGKSLDQENGTAEDFQWLEELQWRQWGWLQMATGKVTEGTVLKEAGP